MSGKYQLGLVHHGYEARLVENDRPLNTSVTMQKQTDFNDAGPVDREPTRRTRILPK